ncbi:carboxymuconolactone decarboxylase-like protein [Ophiobolus disseminans]|uniref:Carboxymuconolactone decarboxylase-like protein n=1 Tax=Ophiobolus disseminans TaxID=1469910 RepID=A0A6A7A232_9PLEO|nr:carboxymuconolactone decarboxylase-like protein [Ophiobolus disseminans]
MSPTNQTPSDPPLPPSLSSTDPELLSYFTAFTHEVSQHSTLDTHTRHMVLLAASIGKNALTQWTQLLRAALTNATVSPIEAKELVYQAVPYVGIACALDFIAATNHVLQEQGVKLPLDPQSTTTPESRLEDGTATQKHILGAAAVDKMYASAPADLMHIQRYLSANCFGDHYTRGGVDVPLRELLTFSMLAAQGGCDAQVKAHVGMNVNVGNGRQRLIDVATVLLPFIGYPRTLNAIAAVNEGAPAGKE